MSSLENKQK